MSYYPGQIAVYSELTLLGRPGERGGFVDNRWGRRGPKYPKPGEAQQLGSRLAPTLAMIERHPFQPNAVRRLGLRPSPTWASTALCALIASGCASASSPDSDGSSASTDPTTSGSIESSPAPTDSGSSNGTGPSGSTEPSPGTDPPDPSDPVNNPGVPATVGATWFEKNTLSLRADLSLPYQGQVLDAEQLAEQLQGYDPGSLLRCAVSDDTNYRAAVDALGGVTWGYGVRLLEDLSKPRIVAGYERPILAVPGAATADGASVEIVKPDVVAVTESAALFYSRVHGLLLVNLTGDTPSFECAAQMPGHVDQFFFHEGHLVAMTRAQNGGESALLHFDVTGSELKFVEKVSLGRSNILDSRRFNDRLVFYTDLSLVPPQENDTAPPSNDGSGAELADIAPDYVPTNQHRALHVYKLGDKLEKESYDTLIDTSVDEQQLYATVTADTPRDTVVNESKWFGANMWASDHYFVVTEQITKTLVDYWKTDVYSVCTESHTTETPYQYCWTEYETRPNPDYVEPDNSGGDRSCRGTTLSDCLVQVAKVSNKTIQVPVGQKCRQDVRVDWFCDAYEQRTAEYPVYKYDDSTRLYIYEYTDAGFVQVDAKVHEVDATALADAAPTDQVETIKTSTESFDLAVAGSVQTLYFQNGYLYVISNGVLQTYAMGGSSIVRTATLPVVNETLQSSLFTDEQLFLSDFGYSWSAGDHSTLRVVDLSNPAFPKIEASTHDLPGGHSSILATTQGIFTIGTVQQFMGQAVNAVKLGLFSNPYAEEAAYLILGTDLSSTWLGADEAKLFDSQAERLLLPYSGYVGDYYEQEFRVGVSRLEPGNIASEGAVVVPENVERVRRLTKGDPSYLSFAPNSIEWLTPADGEWQTQPILEYLVPDSVYRLNEENDYVEFQRLGNRCRLYFANANDINQRRDGAYSEEFTCTGWAQAFANKLLLQKGSVEFDEEHAIRLLSDEEVTALREQIDARPICVLSDELLDNTYVDPQTLPDDATVTCMSVDEYYAHSQALMTDSAPEASP